MKNYLNYIVIAISLSGLFACASTEETDSAARTGFSDCIYEGTIRDYIILDDANLLVTASAKRNYHIALSRRAFGLRSAWKVGFTSPTERICAGFSDIVVDAGAGLEKIRIRSIRRLTAEQTDALLVQYGRKKPEIEQAPTPQPVEGAEVEELDEVADRD